LEKWFNQKMTGKWYLGMAEPSQFESLGRNPRAIMGLMVQQTAENYWRMILAQSKKIIFEPIFIIFIFYF